MVLIRNASQNSIARFVARGIMFALLVLGTVSCDSSGQHVYTGLQQGETTTTAITSAPRNPSAAPNPVIISAPSYVRPSSDAQLPTSKPAVVANAASVADNPAPVPAYGTASYRPGPYGYAPMGAILPTAH